MVMGMANLAMATGNIGRDGVGVNPLRGQNNVQGSCDMGSFPHELSGYRHVSDDAARADVRGAVGARHPARARAAHPQHVRRRDRRHVPGAVRAGRGHRPVRPEHRARRWPRCARWSCVVVQDLFLNETAKFAHVFLPGTSFLEKDGTFTNAERRINRVRPVMTPRDGKQEWEVVVRDRRGARRPRCTTTTPSEIMDEIAALTPTFAGVSFAQLDEVGSVQWPCNDDQPPGTPIMHEDTFVRGQGPVRRDAVRAHRGALDPPLPAAAHHRPDPQPVQRRRADPAHRQRRVAPRGRARDPPARRRGARHRRRRRGHAGEPGRRHHAARQALRPDAARASSTRRSTTRSAAPTS